MSGLLVRGGNDRALLVAATGATGAESFTTTGAFAGLFVPPQAANAAQATIAAATNFAISRIVFGSCSEPVTASSCGQGRADLLRRTGEEKSAPVPHVFSPVAQWRLQLQHASAGFELQPLAQFEVRTLHCGNDYQFDNLPIILISRQGGFPD